MVVDYLTVCELVMGYTYIYETFLWHPFVTNLCSKIEDNQLILSSFDFEIIIIDLFIVGDKNTINDIFISTNVALNTWLI